MKFDQVVSNVVWSNSNTYTVQLTSLLTFNKRSIHSPVTKKRHKLIFPLKTHIDSLMR